MADLFEVQRSYNELEGEYGHIVILLPSNKRLLARHLEVPRGIAKLGKFNILYFVSASLAAHHAEKYVAERQLKKRKAILDAELELSQFIHRVNSAIYGRQHQARNDSQLKHRKRLADAVEELRQSDPLISHLY